MNNLTRPDDDDLVITQDPLEVVERVLSTENLDFERTEDGDLAFAIAGDWKEYEMWFAWRPQAECLQICLSIDRKVESGVLAAACRLVNLINQRVWLGHFEVWADDGEIIFRHAMGLPEGERPSLAQAASMIDASLEAADRFYPAFEFLVAGKTPEEAMTACMFETLGQA